jgi:hypothetical protein
MGRRKVVVAKWESWNGEIPAVVPDLTAPVAATVDRAASAFLAQHAEASSQNTQKKYKLLMNRLKGFSAAKGYVLIEQWGRSISASFVRRGD